MKGDTVFIDMISFNAAICDPLYTITMIIHVFVHYATLDTESRSRTRIKTVQIPIANRPLYTNATDQYITLLSRWLRQTND